MENAAEALKIAGWVLIFVLALSLSMNAFAQAKQSIDQILIASDREYITTYIDKRGGEKTRIVGTSTIVPTIYRAYRENFKVRIDYSEYSGGSKIPFYQVQVLGSDGITKENKPVFEIDLENQILSGETLKDYFIKRILIGTRGKETTLEDIIPSNSIVKSPVASEDDFYNSAYGFYDFITRNNITAREELGVYYQDEINGATTESTANKTEKRVVTYYLH